MHYTTNLAECWMNIRKFDGGKQYNRSQSEAWEGRCSGAGLRQNLGPHWGAITWEKVTGEEANPIFKKTTLSNAKKVESDRKRKATNEARKKRVKTKFQRTNDDSLQARRDYARHDGGPDIHEVHQDIPGDHLQHLVLEYYSANDRLSRAKAMEIESLTRTQAAASEVGGNLWMAERRKRITASVCGTIAKRRTTTKVGNLVKTLLYSTFRGNTATEWGKLHETESKETYLREKRRVSPHISVTESGLVVHHYHHWLGASPDGLVYNPVSTEPEGIVEFKNPYSARTMTLQDASQSKGFCLVNKDGSLQLKRTHVYFYQIQATMFCTERKWYDFVVCTTVDLHIERITFNPDFWKPIIPRLRSFYFSAILPELAMPRLRKGGIRELSDWLGDQEAWRRQLQDF